MSEIAQTTELTVLPRPSRWLTPADLRGQIEAAETLVREGVLRESHDYGRIPNTPKPTLFKSGAERLLLWARMGHRFEIVEVERDGEGHKYGVTYRCVIHALDDAAVIVATCDGYCGYDEPDRDEHQNRWNKLVLRSPWNTILKMAQKRALVGAALQATGTSSLFTQDLEDMADTAAAAGAVMDDLGDIAKMTNRQVVDALRARNLPLAGKPEELRKRLAEAVGSEPPAGVDAETGEVADGPSGGAEKPQGESARDSRPTPAEANTGDDGAESEPSTAPQPAEKPETKGRAAKRIAKAVEEMDDAQVRAMVAAYEREPIEDPAGARGQLIGLMLDEEFPPEKSQQESLPAGGTAG